MGYRGKPIRLATGIYQDRYRIVVRVGGKDIGRFPIGTPLPEMRQAQRDYRDGRDLPSPETAGTLGAWFDDYLRAFPKGPHRRDEGSLLQHWRDAGFDAKVPSAVVPLEIRQQLARWHGRFAPRTINHLRRVLGAVYTSKNGRAGFNPVRDVPKITILDEEPRAVPYELIEFIFRHMPDRGRGEKGSAKKDGGPGRPTVGKAKIRLRVMAYTSRPPAELKRIQPRDLFLDEQAMIARPRRKGAGARGKRVPLTDQGVEALRAFVRHDCFGPFSTRSVGKTWRRAVTKARAAWEKAQAARGAKAPVPWPLPDDVRAYDLRHSFASAMMRATDGNLKAVADHLLHTSLKTTERYTLAVVDEQMQRAAAALSAFWQAGTTREPQDHGKRRQNPRKPHAAARHTRHAGSRGTPSKRANS